MRPRHVLLACAACLLVGTTLGLLASEQGGASLFKGKSPKEAALAALVEAEKVAGDGSWENIGVGRVYYLSGDKVKGQAFFDKVTKGRPVASDWQRIGDVYLEAGEKDKAQAAYEKITLEAKDDSGHAELGAAYIRLGQRDKGEEYLAKALSRKPKEVWHWVRAAQAYLGVPNY
jgi:tetratricopeptide (TPR) repeat protein